MRQRGEYVSLDDSESAQVGLFERINSISVSGIASNARLAAFADRGSGYYQEERDKRGEASLIETGRHAGRSRVVVNETKDLSKHTWTRDLFTSLVNLKMVYLFTIICVLELTTWAFWCLVWFTYHHATGRKCMHGIEESTMLRTFVSTLLFTIETQQTIGYGSRAPAACALGACILIMQCLTQLVLEAVCVGLVFARLSHPKARGRSIFISESAVIARRDGALKLMFRIADARTTQVIAPKISAYLYTWGRGGRVTAEGERIACRVEELEIQYNDGMLLLPVICEHAITYSSPLFGVSHDMMVEWQTEVVVVLQGTNESGGSFSVRQSYLPNEIHWGHTFVQIIHRAVPPDTRHHVALSRFHEVEPLPGLGMMTPSECSHYCLQHEKGVVPFPSVNEDSLVISDNLVICIRSGRYFLMARIGDTCPRNTMTVVAKAYLYQWKQRVTPEGEILPFKMRELQLCSRDQKGNPLKTNELLLRMPQLVVHEIGENSPIASWVNGESAMYQADMDSEIVFQVTGKKLTTGNPTLVKRTFTVAKDIKYGHHFQVMVAPPSIHGKKPTIDWRLFHRTLKSRRAGADQGGASGPVPTRLGYRPPSPASLPLSGASEMSYGVAVSTPKPPRIPMVSSQDSPAGIGGVDSPEQSEFSPQTTVRQVPMVRRTSSAGAGTQVGRSSSDVVQLAMAAAAAQLLPGLGEAGGDALHIRSAGPSAPHSAYDSHESSLGSRPTLAGPANTSPNSNQGSGGRSTGTGGMKASDQHWGAKRSLAGLSFQVDDDDDDADVDRGSEACSSTWQDHGTRRPQE